MLDESPFSMVRIWSQKGQIWEEKAWLDVDTTVGTLRVPACRSFTALEALCVHILVHLQLVTGTPYLWRLACRRWHLADDHTELPHVAPCAIIAPLQLPVPFAFRIALISDLSLMRQKRPGLTLTFCTYSS
jgi:hypothetical protein